MSTTSGVRPAEQIRRSTRVDESIPITVVGVDSARGPYREQVFTTTLSYHGCKYESKFDVLNDSVVILELAGDKADEGPVTVRGRVKWAKRPSVVGGPYVTAVELEEPGNIWKLSKPPKDWQELAAAPKPKVDAAKPQPFLVSRAETETAEAAEKANGGAAKSQVVAAARSAAAISDRPLGDLMRNFQSEMETMLSEAATAAVRERAAAAVEEARATILKDAKRVVAETGAAQAAPLIEHSLRQFKQASQETALAFQVQWTLQLEDEVKKAVERVEERHLQLEVETENASAAAIDRLQKAVESARRDGIDRIIAGLKEQFTPLVEQAKTAAAELSACKTEASKILDQSLESFSARAEEICAGAQARFEESVRHRLDSAQEELDRSGIIASNLALDSLRQSLQKHELEVRARLEKDVAPASNAALAALRESAEAARRQFVDDLNASTHQHFEKIGVAIAHLGKGKTKGPQE